MAHVVPYLHEDWVNFGYQLLEDRHANIIDEILADIHGDVKKCSETLLRRWLKLDYADTTWNKLLNTLQIIERFALAHQIADKLLPGIQKLQRCMSCSRLAS